MYMRVSLLFLSHCLSYKNGDFTMMTMISRATSIHMNTKESITVPIGGADRKTLHDRDLHRRSAALKS